MAKVKALKSISLLVMAGVVTVFPGRSFAIDSDSSEVDYCLVPDQTTNVLEAPIVLRLTITNRSSETIICLINDIEHPRLILSSPDADRPFEDNVPTIPSGGGFGPVPIRPQGVYATTVALTKFLKFSKPGAVRVNYVLRERYFKESEDMRSLRDWTKEGSFVLTLVARDDAVIEEKFQRLLADLKATTGMTQAVVASTLCSVDTPLAVKYIQRIFELDKREPVNINCKYLAVSSLARINTEQSMSLLKSIVLSDTSVADRGLSSLAEKRMALSLDELKPFLTSKAPRIKYVALEYIEKMGNSDYSSAVEALTVDPNIAIATKAKTVAEALKP